MNSRGRVFVLKNCENRHGTNGVYFTQYMVESYSNIPYVYARLATFLFCPVLFVHHSHIYIHNVCAFGFQRAHWAYRDRMKRYPWHRNMHFVPLSTEHLHTYHSFVAYINQIKSKPGQTANQPASLRDRQIVIVEILILRCNAHSRSSVHKMDSHNTGWSVW